MTVDQKWRRLIAWIRKNHPPHLPFKVRSVPDSLLKGDHGKCYLDNDEACFIILINRTKCYSLKVDTLLHEAAHALTWFGAETHIDDHSAEWGVAYAKLYRTLHERQEVPNQLAEDT